MTASEINSIVSAFGSILDVLRDADPADKAEIYSGVGLRLTFQPARNAVIAEAAPPAIMYEGLCPRGKSGSKVVVEGDGAGDADLVGRHGAGSFARSSRRVPGAQQSRVLAPSHVGDWNPCQRAAWSSS
jgi:hypothetical protein